MVLDRLFARRAGRHEPNGGSPRIETHPRGIEYSIPGAAASDWLATPFAFPAAAQLGARLHQLHLDGYGSLEASAFVLPWQDVYELQGHDIYGGLAAGLGLPPPLDVRPALMSQGSLADPSFRVAIAQWVDGGGLPLRGEQAITGAVFKTASSEGLVPRPVWELLEHLARFHAAAEAERTPVFNERAWAQMRRLATAAKAPMSDYLEKTVVVTPEKLRFEYRRARIAGDEVIELIPTFDGAPAQWLDRFDRLPLQDNYNLPDGAGMTRVVLSQPVKRVLAEIKGMPGRRVTGARAEALIANPMAALGPAAAEAVDPAQVEQALVEARLTSFRFVPAVRRSDQGVIEAVILRVETLHEGEPGTWDREVVLEDADALERFCERLRDRAGRGLQWCAWAGYDFDILPETSDHLRQLQAWLGEWRAAAVWTPEDLFDLSNYSPRIAEIGVERPYALPFVQRRSVELDWFVKNVLMGLLVRPPGSEHETLVQVETDNLPAMQQAIADARARGQAEVLLPGAPAPIPLDHAERAVGQLQEAASDLVTGTFKPGGRQKTASSDERAEPKRLVVKSNIDAIDHAEDRAELLAVPGDTAPKLPSALRPSTALKSHQKAGVAWLQHLWAHSPGSCRGALLADDMGLGKTLQLLTFIVRALEDEPDLPPALVVAPVALLENWCTELDRFFERSAVPMLTLYGNTLRDLRIDEDQLGAELTLHGITRLLRKDWAKGARLVLTTYETLRDLEFTLAAQPWSVMVCDEAQKIKNPNAMVTRAAKKLNVRFRIACTGTPVENTLMDLWCLFDFIQPGLLGALSSFSRTYKQPIEAKTDVQKAKVEELRRLIEPQTLRRTKAEVAGDSLPKKAEDDSCRALPMSRQQQQHYWAALEQLKKQRASDPSAVLQTLHHIRRICSDPHWQDPQAALKMPLRQLQDESPKLRWMLKRLKELKAASGRPPGEKVIVFCEFRDLQIQLQRVIREHLGLDVFVVNGETSASADVENSRQKLIDRFQARPGFNVIVLSPLAVGFGVNIQAANHVIHFTRTWNPAKEDQATDRAYRIGQTRDVTVYYPSVVGDKFDSFDMVLHKLLAWKRELAADMLNAPGDLTASDFQAVAA